MPIYEFTCDNCPGVFEEFCKYEEKNSQICPQCQGKLSYIFSVPNGIIDAKKPKTIGDLARKNTEERVKRGQVSEKALEVENKKALKKEKQKKLGRLANASAKEKERYIETGKI